MVGVVVVVVVVVTCAAAVSPYDWGVGSEDDMLVLCG